MIRGYGLVAVALFLGSLATAGTAQLLSERVDGLSRLCTYSGTANVVSGGPTRTLRIGIGQNCPFSYPPETPGRLPAPPTAQLRSVTVSQDSRVCGYEQAGTTWTLEIAITQSCPLFAGMVPQAPDPAQRRMTRARTPDRQRP